MRRPPWFLAVLALVLGAPTLGAQRSVDLRWALDPDGDVKVYNYVGRVRIVGWDRDSVVVTGTTAVGVRMFGGGSRAGIKVGAEGDQRTAADSVVLLVRVPVGADVWVRGAATDIEVEGLIGAVDVGTVSGQVTVRGAPRSAIVETMDGTLTIRGTPTVLRAKTASGRLEFTGAAREVVLGTVSGEVRVRAGPLGLTRIETIAGPVDFDATLETGAQLTIETHSGNIVAYVPKGSLDKVTARSFRGTISIREK